MPLKSYIWKLNLHLFKNQRLYYDFVYIKLDVYVDAGRTVEECLSP